MSAPDRAVLFDLDETLYLERRFALSGFAAVSRALSAEAGVSATWMFQQLAGALRRGERATAFQRLCRALDWPSSRLPALLDIYRSHIPNLRLPPASRRALLALRGSWRLGVVTNGPVAIQTAKVVALDLAAWVDVVVYAAECGSGEGKPAPEPFAVAAQRIGVVAARCVFVGDDPRCDVAGARRAGMKTIRIRQGAHAGVPLDASDEADAVIRVLRDVPRLASALLGETAGRTA